MIRVQLFSPASQAVVILRSQLGLPMPSIGDKPVDHANLWFGPKFDAILSRLSLGDLNFILYKSDPEERESGSGGVYELDNGSLPYAGIQGRFMVSFGCFYGVVLGCSSCISIAIDRTTTDNTIT